MITAPKVTSDPVRERLLKAALDCFLSDEYNKVTTRLIAEKADANISMIRYYFSNKEGLYEEMISDTMTVKRLSIVATIRRCFASQFKQSFH
jgi:AcrR family transcriptional regulator